MNDRSLKMNTITRNQNKILGLLLRQPAESRNLNQIARKLNISKGSAHKILRDFWRRDILKVKKLGNATYYALNFKSKETKKLAELILLEDRLWRLNKNPAANVYAEEIERFKAKSIILFGSLLTKQKKANDIDVLFIVDRADVKNVNDFCLNLSKTKTKPVIPLILTEKDFREKLKINDKVILEITRTGVILAGEDIFVSLLEAVYNGH